MNTKTVYELNDIAKEHSLYGYYKLKKADLIALSSEIATQVIPTPQQRTKKYKKGLYILWR